MNDVPKSLVKVPDGTRIHADPPKPFPGFFEFFYFPLGSSFIFIAIIGFPRGGLFKMKKYAASLSELLKTE